MAPGTGELPTHLLYMLVFGGLVVIAVSTLFVEFGTRTGKRRLGMAFWSVLAGLVGAVCFAINVANVLQASTGAG
jgi:uncharacterized membrane protein YwaF